METIMRYLKCLNSDLKHRNIQFMNNQKQFHFSVSAEQDDVYVTSCLCVFFVDVRVPFHFSWNDLEMDL